MTKKLKLATRQLTEYDERDIFIKKRLYITQLCLWTTLLCIIPIFPRFMNIANWYGIFASSLLVANLLTSASCAFGLFSTFKVKYCGTDHVQDSQNRLAEIHIKMRHATDPRKIRRLERQEARASRSYERRQRKLRKKTPYDALHYCLPYILLFPVTMVNLIWIAIFILAIDNDPMRPAKYIILFMIIIWAILAPFPYFKLVKLYYQQMCGKLRKPCCSSSSSDVTINEDDILKIDEKYFQKNNVELRRQLSLY